jgi:thiol-disulfide isomerase/thioredoxin
MMGRLVTVGMLVAAVAGCSSARLGRPRIRPGVRTITMIGDRPESVVAGMPGASAGSGPLMVDRAVGRDGRIYGRVVDERGRPLAGVEVRVADGGALAGRDVSTVTDEAGGFVLRGLRAHESYTLVASQPERRNGRYGRRRVVAPDGDVEIVLRAPEGGRIAQAPMGAGGARVEDSEPIRLPPRGQPEEPALDRSVVRRTSSVEADGWRSAAEQRAATAHQVPAIPAPRDELRRLEGWWDQAEEDDSEEVNPLPPALERPAPPQSGGFEEDRIQGAEPLDRWDEPMERGERPEPFTAGDGPLVPVFPGLGNEPEGQDGGDGEFTPPSGAPDPMGGEWESPPRVPPPSPEPSGPLDPGDDLSEFRPVDPENETEPAPSGGEVEPESAARSGQEPEDERADEPGPAIGDGQPPAIEPPGVSRGPDERPEPVRRVTWSDLARRSQAEPRLVTEPTPPLKYPRSVRRWPRPQPLPPAAAAPTRPAAGDAQVARTAVRFDGRTNRLVDFTVADLEGRPVRFSDLDADYVLLDFWGTWCAPCAKTMPHLVELQERYDPARLRVVGIAYERGPLAQQVAAVRRMTRQFGVNYPILLGEQDGRPCPLLAALRVDQYPTLILLDRHGRILWRDSGSRSEMLERLDRVIAANTSRQVETRRR